MRGKREKEGGAVTTNLTAKGAKAGEGSPSPEFTWPDSFRCIRWSVDNLGQLICAFTLHYPRW